MMPLAALATCILILRVVGIDGMEKEIEQSSPFRRKKHVQSIYQILCNDLSDYYFAEFYCKRFWELSVCKKTYNFF